MLCDLMLVKPLRRRMSCLKLVFVFWSLERVDSGGSVRAILSARDLKSGAFGHQDSRGSHGGYHECPSPNAARKDRFAVVYPIVTSEFRETVCQCCVDDCRPAYVPSYCQKMAMLAACRCGRVRLRRNVG